MKNLFTLGFFILMMGVAAPASAANPACICSNDGGGTNPIFVTSTATATNAFIDTLGVNTHIVYKDGAYANAMQVVNDMHFLGISHVRDGIAHNWTPDTAGLSDYAILGNGGIKFNLITASWIQSGSGTFLQRSMQALSQIAQVVPAGSIVAVEGLNEVNNAPVSYNGLSGDAAAMQVQQDLYAAVHSSASLPNTVVYDLTGLSSKIATLSGRADFGNAHPFPHNGGQPLSPMISSYGDAYSLAQPFPRVATEAGNCTLPASWNPVNTPAWDNPTMLCVDEATQAKSVLNTYFDGAALGIARTYVYELLDEKFDDTPVSQWGDAGHVSSAGEWHFGLFRNNHTPKASAVTIRNLVSILNTNNSNVVNADANGQLSYYFNNLPSTASTYLLQKGDGRFVLAVWNNVPFWNWTWDPVNSTSTPVNSTPVQVMLNLQRQASAIEIYDPTVGTTPVDTKQNVGGFTMTVPDHVVLIMITLTPKPVDCAGGHANGSTWSETTTPTVSGSDVVNPGSVCQFGGTQIYTSTTVTNYACNNGTITNSSTTTSATTLQCNIPADCAGGHAHGSSWTTSGTPLVITEATPVDSTCPFAGTRTKTTTPNMGYSCSNGVITFVPTASTVTYGATICNIASSCNGHASGSSWSDAGTPVVTTETLAPGSVCQYGGTRSVTTTPNMNHVCTNGSTASTVGTPTVVYGAPVCNTPASCGNQASGTSWTTDGTVTTETASYSGSSCANGGTQVKTTTQKINHSCTNGVTTDTAGTPAVVFSAPVCSAPQGCGVHGSGSSWTDNGTPVVTTEATTADSTCPFGGTRTKTTTPSTNHSCNNGTVTDTAGASTVVYGATVCNTPTNCNGHASGSSWTTNGTSVVTSEAIAPGNVCQYGGSRSVTTTPNTSHSCTNGVTTDAAAASTVVYGAAVCNTPASCNGHASGSVWTTDGATTTDTVSYSGAPCTNGGTQIRTTVAKINHSCTNGVTTDSNGTAAVSYAAPVCTPVSIPTPPSTCSVPRSIYVSLVPQNIPTSGKPIVGSRSGSTAITVANGQMVWVTGAPGSSTRAATVKECGVGKTGTVTTTWTNQVLDLCTNGSLSDTGRSVMVNIVVGKPVCTGPSSAPVSGTLTTSRR